MIIGNNSSDRFEALCILGVIVVPEDANWLIEVMGY